MDNDNILSFEDLKKKKENLNTGLKGEQLSSLFGNISDGEKEQIKNMFNSLGLGNEEMKEQLDMILNAKSLEEIMDKGNNSFFDPNMIGKMTEEAKKANERYKSEYKYYRELSQWINIYKPYTLDKLLLIEKVKEIAKIIDVEISDFDSKNDILNKIKPKLNIYLEKEISNFSSEKMAFLGKVIFNMGTLRLENPLTEIEEKEIDYFSSKGLIFRINENGKKTLIIPQEILEAMQHIDFRKFDIAQKVNSIIIGLISGLANVYGVIPTDEGIEIVWKVIEEQNLFTNKEAFLKQFWEIADTNFSKSVIIKGIVSNAAINERFIFHPMVGFVEEFYNSQSKSDYGYKEFEFEELMLKGKENYFEDSIHMRSVCDCLDIIDDEFNIQSTVYTFSKMEFEPQMIIALLETMTEIPIGYKYELLMDSLKSISKRTEKWILKGYKLGEDTEKGETVKDIDYDPSKIINIDFHKK